MENTREKSRMWLGGCILVSILTVGLLPVLLFSSFVLELGFTRLTPVIGGKLTADSCSGGYLGSISCSNVRYESSKHDLRFAAAEVSLDRGILALLSAPRNLGELVVHSPVLTVYREAPQKRQEAEASPQTKPPSQGDESSSGKTGAGAAGNMEVKSGKPFWDELLVRLRMIDGRLVINAPDKRYDLLNGINIQAELLEGTVEYTLGFTMGAENGRVEADGHFNLPIHNQAAATTITTATELHLSTVELDTISELAELVIGEKESLPRGKGVVSGEVFLSTAGLENIVVNSQLDVEALGFSGGFLEPDTPFLGDVHLVVDVSRTGGSNWSFPQLLVEGSSVHLTGSGILQEEGGELQLSGRLSLPALSAELPHSLGLREGAEISEGELTVVSSIHRSTNTTSFIVQCSTTTVSGRYGDQLLVWDNPLTVDIQGQYGDGNISLSSLDLTTPFFQVYGEGDRSRFQVTGEIQVEKALSDIDDLFDVKGRGQGTLLLGGTGRIDEQQQYQIELSVRSEDFGLELVNGPVVPSHPFHLRAETKGMLTSLPEQGNPLAVSLNFDGWLGKISLLGSDIQPFNRFAGRYSVESDVLLEPLQAFARSFAQPLYPSLHLAGRGALSLSGDWNPPLASVHKARMELAEFMAGDGELNYEDERVVVSIGHPFNQKNNLSVQPLRIFENYQEYAAPAVHSWFNIASGELLVARFSLDSGLLQVHDGRVEVKKPGGLPEVAARIVGAMRLEDLAEIGVAAGKISGEIELEGNATVVAEMRHTPFQETADLKVLMDDVALRYGEKSFLDKDEVTAGSMITHQPGTGSYQLLELEVESPYGALLARGEVDTGLGSRLDLDGTVKLRSQEMGILIKTLTGQEVQLGSWGAGKFRITSPVRDTAHAGNWPIALSYNGSLDSLQWRAMNMKEASFGVDYDAPRGAFALNGGLNGGSLSLQADISSDKGPTYLEVREPYRVLSDIELGPAVMEGVLGRVHPLLGVISQPEGQLSMYLEDFNFRVGEADSAVFTTTLDLNDIRINRSGVLGEVLRLLQVGDELPTLADTEVTCSGIAGRVTCAPVRLLIKDSEMTLSGSVGYDGTVDYRLLIPVTQELIGKEGYRVLEGTEISVPITGTVENPFFSRDNLSKALKSVLEQAALKAVEKQVEKILPGLLDRLLGN